MSAPTVSGDPRARAEQQPASDLYRHHWAAADFAFAYQCLLLAQSGHG